MPLDNETRSNMEITMQNIANLVTHKVDNNGVVGSTHYIDLAKPTCLPNNITVGKNYDEFGRPFYVFKATIFVNDKKCNTFTTFFKRYSDYSSLLWHTAGHYGRQLFNTEYFGGARLAHMQFLLNLFTNKEVVLTREEATNLGIYRDFLEKNEEYSEMTIKLDAWDSSN